MKRRCLLQAAGLTTAALGLGPGPARAQGDWPSRPVTLLVPFIAGGPSDTIARLLAGRLQERLGQPFEIANHPGNNGQLAGRLLAQAPPDGHTMMVGSIGVLAINAALRPDLGYDPVRDFSPITLAVTTPNVLVVNPGIVPVDSAAGLIAWLMAHPGQAYSSSGIGSSEHLTTELFKLRTGTDIRHQPFAGGAAGSDALITGQVQMAFHNLGTVAHHIAAGRLRALAVTSLRRTPVLPDVPTAGEAGLDNFMVTSWQAVTAPAGLPIALRTRLNHLVVEALRHPATMSRLQPLGFTVVANAPEAYARFQQSEIDRWHDVVTSAGLSAE